MYSPLAWVIIGGLLSSTFVARIVTPAIYKLIPPAIETSQDQRGMIEIWPSRSRIA
jgi:Cu/Ag efflux pump CusA